MSLLIKNVRVLCSPKQLPERVDVLVSGSEISAIGNFPQKKADRVIDGQGGYLAPGFIDIDTASDHYLTLLDDPGQEEFLSEGVTTTIGGHCGVSLAPLLYGTLESAEPWANLRATNVNWKTIREFLEMLKKKRLGVNFGTFAGHTTIRRSLINEANRDLTKNELKVFEGILDRSLSEGAFGLSLGLEYVHARSTPYSELKFLASKVAAKNAILSVHLRHTGQGIKEAMEEVLRLNRDTGVRILIAHMTPKKASEGEFEVALEMLSKLPKENEVYFSVAPFNWRTVPLYKLLPEWAQNGDRELMAKSIKDDWMAKRIMRDIADIPLESFAVEQAPDHPSFEGKTLGEIMEMMGKDNGKDALLEIMRTTKFRAVVSIEDVSLGLLKKALSHERALIGSHLPSFSSGTFHFRRAFTEFINRAGDNSYSMEEAVKRLTAAPAAFLRMPKKGEIKEGNIADLALIRNGEIAAVSIAGAVAMEEGKMEKRDGGNPIYYGK